MGDMGEVFRGMTKQNKERRQRNLEKNKKSKLPWHEFTPWHWRVTLQGDDLDFWPTKNKWRWRGKMYHGDVEGFIKKRLSEPDDTGQLQLELETEEGNEA